MSNLFILILFLSIVFVYSFSFCKYCRKDIFLGTKITTFLQQTPIDGQSPPPVESNRILKRKGQVPSPSLGPEDVVKICLSALQFNDDPRLDHGASVVM